MSGLADAPSGFPAYVASQRRQVFDEIAQLAKELNRPGIDGDSELIIRAQIDRLLDNANCYASMHRSMRKDEGA